MLQNVFAGAAPIRGRQSGRPLVASRQLNRSATLVREPTPARSKTPPVGRVLAPQTPESMRGSPQATVATIGPDQASLRQLTISNNPLSTFERFKVEEYLDGQLSFGPAPTPLAVDRPDSELDSWLLGQAERSDPPPQPDDDVLAQLTPTPILEPQPSLSSSLHVSQMTQIAGPCLIWRCPRA